MNWSWAELAAYLLQEKDARLFQDISVFSVLSVVIHATPGGKRDETNPCRIALMDPEPVGGSGSGSGSGQRYRHPIQTTTTAF